MKLANSNGLWRAKGGRLLLCLLVLVCFGAPWLARYAPDDQSLSPQTRLQAPTTNHPLGTDQFGRDVLARVLHGGQISLGLAFSTMLLAVLFGTCYGAIAGYTGGGLDQALMRIVDLFLTFPLIFLVATCLALFGNNLSLLITILALTAWMDIARLVRAEVLALKNEAFVIRAQASGLPKWRIVWSHVLPGILATVLAAAVLRMADLILVESAMTFLGLGVQPPTATWGAILQDGRQFLGEAWWLMLFPGLAIALTTVSLYLMAEDWQNTASRRIQRVR